MIKSEESYRYVPTKLLKHSAITGAIYPYRKGGLIHLEDALFLYEAIAERCFYTILNDSYESQVVKKNFYCDALLYAINIVRGFMIKINPKRTRRIMNLNSYTWFNPAMLNANAWSTIDSDSMSFTYNESKESEMYETRQAAIAAAKAKYDAAISELENDYLYGENHKYAITNGKSIKTEEDAIPGLIKDLEKTYADEIERISLENKNATSALYDNYENEKLIITTSEELSAYEKSIELEKLNKTYRTSLNVVTSRAAIRKDSALRERLDQELELYNNLLTLKLEVGKDLYNRSNAASPIYNDAKDQLENEYLTTIRENSIPKVSYNLALRNSITPGLVNALLTTADSAIATMFPSKFSRCEGEDTSTPRWLTNAGPDDSEEEREYLAVAREAFGVYTDQMDEYIDGAGESSKDMILSIYSDLEKVVARPLFHSSSNGYIIHYGACERISREYNKEGETSYERYESIPESTSCPWQSTYNRIDFTELPWEEESQWSETHLEVKLTKYELIIIAGDRKLTSDGIKYILADVIIEFNASTDNLDWQQEDGDDDGDVTRWEIKDEGFGYSSKIMWKRVKLEYAGVYCDNYMNKLNEREEQRDNAIEQLDSKLKATVNNINDQKAEDLQKESLRYKENIARIDNDISQQTRDAQASFIESAFSIMTDANSKIIKGDSAYEILQAARSAIQSLSLGRDTKIEKIEEEGAEKKYSEKENYTKIITNIEETYGTRINKAEQESATKKLEINEEARKDIKAIKEEAVKATGLPEINSDYQYMFKADLGDLYAQLLEFPNAPYQYHNQKISEIASIHVGNVIAVLNPRTLTNLKYN